MYNSKLAVAIKSAGKVLREQKDQVYLPFGSEYSIFIKNLNSVRALVRIDLDGESVTGNNDLVVQPNSSLDLERFLKNGNFNQGNKFKFIERTGKVEANRGVQLEDGLLRVEFQFEKVEPKTVTETIIHKTIHKYEDVYDPWRGYPWKRWYDPPYYTGPFYGACNTNVALNNVSSSYSADSATSCSVASSGLTFNAGSDVGMSNAKPAASMLRSKAVQSPTMDFLEDMKRTEVNEAGITVPGSISDQKFTLVSSFPVEDEKHVIILKLLGETGGKVVERAVTVKYKQVCSTCGTRNRGKIAQFCRECGTALELV